ncbi:MAG: hypothetical protein K0R98_663 [Rickettsiaceae bacterium]|jgi:hypothetical protein|nr:hypothetical protein [Rickettsiaceae bacterium]
MYMVIAVGFILVITGILAFGSYYEAEHFDENHGIRH